MYLPLHISAEFRFELHTAGVTSLYVERMIKDERRQRDARAIEVFEAGVAAISERMEQHVLDVSYTLREGLEEAEGAVNVIREELGRDDVLVCGDMEYVEVRELTRLYYVRRFKTWAHSQYLSIKRNGWCSWG